jgi:hypothetical protein
VWPVSASSTAAHARVSLKDVLALDNQLQVRGWYILAQLHSHPGRAFHSSIDDEHPISNQRGFLSIVVPDFGAGLPGVGWSVYEYAGSGRWRNLSGREVKKRIRDKEAWWQRRLNAIIGRGSYSGH